MTRTGEYVRTGRGGREDAKRSGKLLSKESARTRYHAEDHTRAPRRAREKRGKLLRKNLWLAERPIKTALAFIPPASELGYIFLMAEE